MVSVHGYRICNCYNLMFRQKLSTSICIFTSKATRYNHFTGFLLNIAKTNNPSFLDTTALGTPLQNTDVAITKS